MGRGERRHPGQFRVVGHPFGGRNTRIVGRRGDNHKQSGFAAVDINI